MYKCTFGTFQEIILKPNENDEIQRKYFFHKK